MATLFIIEPTPPVKPINPSFDGGGRGGGAGLNQPSFFKFIFLLKNSLLDHTLRPTGKFHILAIFHHAKKIPENLVYKKFYYISSKKQKKSFSLVRTIEKVIRLCTVNFFLKW